MHVPIPISATTKVECKYDYRDRRVEKCVSTSTNGGTTWTVSSVRRFLYDGWTPIAELDANGGIVLDRTHLWGTDLSGTLEGAGGIGGLLRTRLHSPTGGADYYPTYDANGNVSEYVDSTGSVVAHYEYGPFGGVTAATETMADSFAFRFSTKYLDTETALWYYGYRYYDADGGRWLSRDPIGELGGTNLRGFVSNSPLGMVDPLGLAPPIINDWERLDSPHDGQLAKSIHDPKETRSKVVDGAAKVAGHVEDFVAPGLVVVAATAQQSAATWWGFYQDRVGRPFAEGAIQTHDLLTEHVPAYDWFWSPRGQDDMVALGLSFGCAPGAAYNAMQSAKSFMRWLRFGLKAPKSAVDYPEGSFPIRDWEGYPEGVPQPEGPFRLLEGQEYQTARQAANKANRAMHVADPSLAGKQIHEIKPVKFGGSATDAANKVPLPRPEHTPVTNWWNKLMRDLNKKPGG
jgi:RHS repeat-associated protein